MQVDPTTNGTCSYPPEAPGSTPLGVHALHPSVVHPRPPFMSAAVARFPLNISCPVFCRWVTYVRTASLVRIQPASRCFYFLSVLGGFFWTFPIRVQPSRGAPPRRRLRERGADTSCTTSPPLPEARRGGAGGSRGRRGRRRLRRAPAVAPAALALRRQQRAPVPWVDNHRRRQQQPSRRQQQQQQQQRRPEGREEGGGRAEG